MIPAPDLGPLGNALTILLVIGLAIAGLAGLVVQQLVSSRRESDKQDREVEEARLWLQTHYTPGRCEPGDGRDAWTTAQWVEALQAVKNLNPPQTVAARAATEKTRK